MYNLVLNCDSFRNFDFQYNGENASGIGANRYVGKGNIFIGCRSWENSDNGFEFWQANEGVRLERCYACRNGENIWGHPAFTGNGVGFKLGMGEGRHVLIYCVAWDHWDAGFALNWNTAGAVIFSCTAWRNNINYQFPNKPFKSVLINNMSYVGSNDIPLQLDTKSNSWNTSTDFDINENDFLSLDDSVIMGPRASDGSIPKSNFLRLTSNSDAVDCGTEVGLPFFGEAPDLGAFEYCLDTNDVSSVKILHQAVRDRNVQRIRSLLTEGTDINEKDWLGYTPLHWAIYFGYLNIADGLIRLGARPNVKSDTGQTPLDIAIRLGYKDIAELLINKGVDVNSVDNRGNTLLHRAIQNDQKDIAELLIDKGADINAENNDGGVALDIAMDKYNQEIAKLLIAKGSEVFIHAAAFVGDIKKVKDFIEHGGLVDTADYRGQTLLHWAAAGNHKDIAELLISKGADVNVVAGDRRTPLGAAARTGSVDVAEYLISHGANVNGHEGQWTPLQEAAYHSKDMVELLLNKGADINAGKWTALHSALDAERFDIVELLIDRGADVNIKDGKGRTPLHIAAWYAAKNNPKVVELLIAKGADINARDNNGKTALSLAKEKGYTEIAEILRKHGAREDSASETKPANVPEDATKEEKTSESAPKEETTVDPNAVELNEPDGEIIGKEDSALTLLSLPV